MKITDQNAIQKLISPDVGYSTIRYIRHLILNIYNYNTYQAPNIFSMIRNADDEHQELIYDILETIQSHNEDRAFFVVNKIAPLIIEAGLDEEFLKVK